MQCSHASCGCERSRAKGSHYKIGYYAYGPTAAQVKAEVDAIRRHVPSADDAKIPTSAETDPVIQADEETLIETMMSSGKRSDAVAKSVTVALPLPRPRYLCIVCFRVAGDAASLCPHDDVPLADLAEEEAVDGLRAHVRRTANRRETRRFAVTLTIGVMVGFSVCLCMGWDLDRHGPGPWIMLTVQLFTYAVSRAVLRPIRVRNTTDDLLTAIGMRGRTEDAK